MALEEVGARLSVRNRPQFQAEMAAAKRSIKEVGDAEERVAAKATVAERALSRASAPKISLGFGALGTAIGGITSHLYLLGSAASIGTGIVGALGLKTASTLEQAQISFTTFLGSADQAKAFLADLTSFAVRTPFHLEDVTKLAQQLLGAGFAAQQIKPALTAMGDATAGLGGSKDVLDRIVLAVSQIQTKGRLQGDELLQLAEAGVPASKIIANNLGLTQSAFNRMLQQGAIPASKAIPALLQGIEKGTKGASGATQVFGGLMAKNATTLTGAWSNFTDAMSVGLAEGLQPAIKEVERDLPGLTDRLSGLGATLSPLIAQGVAFGRALATDPKYQGFRDFLSEVVGDGRALWVILTQSVIPAVGDLGGILGMPAFHLFSDTLHFAADHAEGLHRVLVPLLAVMLGYMAVKKVNDTLNGFTKRLDNMQTLMAGEKGVSAVRAFSTAFLGLDAALLASPITWIIAALTAGLVLAYFKVKWFRDGVNSAIDFVRDHWRTEVPLVLLALTGPFGPAVFEVVTHLQQIVSFFESLPGKIKNAIKSVPGIVKDAILGPLSHIPGVGIAKDIGGGIAGGAKAIGGGIAGAFRASGGPVAAGHAYIVGEHQPELFIPNVSGTILPSLNMPTVTLPSGTARGSDGAASPAMAPVVVINIGEINESKNPEITYKTIARLIEDEMARQ